MPIVACRHCDHDVSDRAPLCPSCGGTAPSDTDEARRAWRELRGPSFLRLTSATFIGVLTWSILPLLFWFAGVTFLGALIGGGGG